jgi:hypothetical protein
MFVFFLFFFVLFFFYVFCLFVCFFCFSFSFSVHGNPLFRDGDASSIDESGRTRTASASSVPSNIQRHGSIPKEKYKIRRKKSTDPGPKRGSFSDSFKRNRVNNNDGTDQPTNQQQQQKKKKKKKKSGRDISAFKSLPKRERKSVGAAKKYPSEDFIEGRKFVLKFFDDV